MHLVVLDDNEAVNDFMAAVASRRGWKVDTATHQARFRDLIRASAPDAILLDLQLGDSDGIEELRFLHNQHFAGAVVLISGFDARVLASARQIGNSLGLTMAAVIEKPARAARIGEVLAAIEQHPSLAASPAHRAEQEARKISPREVMDAIDAGQMELHLQPIVAANGHGIQRAEALVRWRDPVRGMVPPDIFVRIAENDEAVIDRLTMWVAETGARHYRHLADAGMPVQICINISGRNIRALDFPDRMAALCERMALPQRAIGLEITETVAMTDLDATTAVLARLRLKGFSVAIDDFGTGHSTLTALRRMPFSALKIDRSFVSEMQTSSDSLTIVRSVIGLAHDLHLACVAEGVETADQARLLTQAGVDGMQGFYFSKPLPLTSFTNWLHEWLQTVHA